MIVAIEGLNYKNQHCKYDSKVQGCPYTYCLYLNAPVTCSIGCKHREMVDDEPISKKQVKRRGIWDIFKRSK